MVKRSSPPSPKLKNFVCSFLVGGTFCVFAEGVKTLLSGVISDEKALASLVMIIMIALGCTLTALGLYDSIAKFAGTGSLVPITGFANAVTSPAMEYRREGIVKGTAVGMFSIAGPVIVFGITSGIVYGLIILRLRALLMPMTEKKSSLIRFKNALSLFFAYSVVGKKEGEGPLGHCFDSVCGDSLLGEKSWEKGKSRMQQLALDGDFAAAGEKVKRGKKATKKPTP